MSNPKSSQPGSDDAALLTKLLAGDARAFMTLVQRHQRGMHAVALFHVGDASVAEEVVQETWEAVVRGLARFEGRSKLSTWILGIVANRARTRGVREKRTVPFSSFGEDDGPAVDADRFRANGHWSAAPAPWLRPAEAIVSDKETWRVLSAALDTLPESQRAVVWMRDIEELDAEEICNVLGITETNQRVLLHRGRSRLRAVLESSAEPR